MSGSGVTPAATCLDPRDMGAIDVVLRGNLPVVSRIFTDCASLFGSQPRPVDLRPLVVRSVKPAVRRVSSCRRPAQMTRVDAGRVVADDRSMSRLVVRRWLRSTRSFQNLPRNRHHPRPVIDATVPMRAFCERPQDAVVRLAQYGGFQKGSWFARACLGDHHQRVSVALVSSVMQRAVALCRPLFETPRDGAGSGPVRPSNQRVAVLPMSLIVHRAQPARMGVLGASCYRTLNIFHRETLRIRLRAAYGIASLERVSNSIGG